MKHLNPDRLLELGLDLKALPTQEESQHLRTCPDCSLDLKAERSLTTKLATLPQLHAPKTLLFKAQTNYAATLEKRRAKQAGLISLLALILGLLAVFAIGTVFAAFSSVIIRALVQTLSQLAFATHIGKTLITSLPIATSLLAFASFFGGLIVVAGLGQLAKKLH